MVYEQEFSGHVIFLILLNYLVNHMIMTYKGISNRNISFNLVLYRCESEVYHGELLVSFEIKINLNHAGCDKVGEEVIRWVLGFQEGVPNCLGRIEWTS